AVGKQPRAQGVDSRHRHGQDEERPEQRREPHCASCCRVVVGVLPPRDPKIEQLRGVGTETLPTPARSTWPDFRSAGIADLHLGGSPAWARPGITETRAVPTGFLHGNWRLPLRLVMLDSSWHAPAARGFAHG